MKLSSVPRSHGLAITVSLCLVILVVLILVAGNPAYAQATTRYVAPSGADSGDCADPFNPCRTVQYAVDQAAANGDTVKVAAGTYTAIQGRPAPAGYPSPPASGTITQVVYLDKTLALQGGYTTTNWATPDPIANPTTLDAQEAGRVLVVSGAISPTVSGFRITGGESTGLGGALFAENSGGGIYILSATATITNSHLFANDAGPRGTGGGLYVLRGHAALRSNTVTDNSAGFNGGGIHLSFSTGSLHDNLITANTAITFGGGLNLVGSPATLEGNTFQANSAGYGGGLNLDSSDVTFRSNSVISNSALVGGGMYMGYAGWVSNTYVLSSTFSQNTGILGGGMWLIYAPVSFVGNIITGNVATDGGGLATSSSDFEFSHNTFASNVAYDEGGAMRLYLCTSPTLTENGFIDNHAGSGGALNFWGSGGTLRGNRIISNSATYGGGLWLYMGDPTILSNTLMANTAALDGGGLFLLQSDAHLTNNVVADNQAQRDGSAVYVAGSAPRLQHNTVARYDSTAGGLAMSDSGIYVAHSEAHVSTVALTNTILAGHGVALTVAVGCTASLEATLWGDGPWSNGADWDGGGTILTGTVNLWGNPAFVEPAAGDYHIGPASEAIDAGIDAQVDQDMDGDPRPTGPGYDLGADESPLGLEVMKEASADPAPAGAQLTYTLRVTNSGTAPFTATITDYLPAHVKPTGVVSWTPVSLLPGTTWLEAVVVTVPWDCAGPLTNVLEVRTDEGATRVYTRTVTVQPGVEPHFHIYLPLVFRSLSPP